MVVTHRPLFYVIQKPRSDVAARAGTYHSRLQIDGEHAAEKGHREERLRGDGGHRFPSSFVETNVCQRENMKSC